MQRTRSQAALDFVLTYGIAILLITVAMYVVLQLGLFNPRVAPISCTPSASFTCDTYQLSLNGSLSMVMSEAIGGTITITGAACSSGVNQSADLPEFGNVQALPYNTVPADYPNNALQYNLKVYSGQEFSITVWCFGNSGVSSGTLGDTFSGSLWINYTYSGLPASVHTVQRVATFTTKYS
ncbi:MAG: hypothetical protein KGH98_04755 [Candidatus Micrarchaeota archaeon]|nr:hypothetical protein [Candidatus Micrarchaeota archaeon]